jgi:hypothetical protein
MGGKEIAYKLLVGKPKGNISLGRYRCEIIKSKWIRQK